MWHNHTFHQPFGGIYVEIIIIKSRVHNGDTKMHAVFHNETVISGVEQRSPPRTKGEHD